MTVVIDEVRHVKNVGRNALASETRCQSCGELVTGNKYYVRHTYQTEDMGNPRVHYYHESDNCSGRLRNRQGG
jgi:hypothetical protein